MPDSDNVRSAATRRPKCAFGIRFLLGRSPELILRRMRHVVRYRKIIEHMEFDLVLSQYPAKSTISILDIGAHHGEVLDILNSTASKHRFHVLCIEPVPSNYRFLRLRVATARLRRHVSVRTACAALGEVTGDVTFYLGSESTLFTTDATHLQRFAVDVHNLREVEVRQFSWSDFAEDYGLAKGTRFDIVKIDAEGADFGILQSLIDSGLGFDAVIVEFSFANDDLLRHCSRLKGLGLDQQYAFVREGTRTLHIGPMESDLFLREQWEKRHETTGNLVCFRGGGLGDASRGHRNLAFRT